MCEYKDIQMMKNLSQRSLVLMKIIFKNTKLIIKSNEFRLVLTVCWICICFGLPLSYVRYVLNNTELREDYVFHASLPSKDRTSTILNFHGYRDNHKVLNDFDMKERKGLFQNVTDNGLALVFSAYLDDMKNYRKLRAIGAKKRIYALNITCMVWYKRDVGTGRRDYVHVNVTGYITEHLEIFERSWAQVHYMCNLEGLPRNPYAVSIMEAGRQAIPLNFIVIHYTAEDPYSNYTVCLHNAFNFRDDVSTQIVEWIEVNRVLGAEHFMIYNYTSYPSNDRVLNWYKNQGILTIIQWDIPLYVDLIFIGEVAVMTDCLYRNFYRSKFISHLDLDEYIVPRKPGITTVPELASSLPGRCGYIVRCVVFSVADGYTEEFFDNKNRADEYQLNTLLTRKRQSKIWNPKDRSKQLLRTACVEIAGVHQVNGYTSLDSEMTFEPSDALMHHYRRGLPRFVKQGSKIRDDFMLTIAAKLIENVSYAWKMIKTFRNSSEIIKAI